MYLSITKLIFHLYALSHFKFIRYWKINNKFLLPFISYRVCNIEQVD